MKVNDLSPSKGSRKKVKRVGRGPGSGHGGTSCRGHKGQKARSGGNVPPGFEGGQMPLHRRLPKRGFTNTFKKSYAVLNVEDLKRFREASELDARSFLEAGLIKEIKNGIKLLGNGDISFPVHVKVHKASISAVKKIEAAGGKVELI